MIFKTAKRYKHWQLRGALVASVADVPGKFAVRKRLGTYMEKREMMQVREAVQ